MVNAAVAATAATVLFLIDNLSFVLRG